MDQAIDIPLVPFEQAPAPARPFVPGYGMIHALASVRLWNAIVPKRVVSVKHEHDAIRVLHPTKGWRRISKKRLALA